MEKIRLGKTNLMVTRVGFGGIPIQRLGEDEAVAVVRRCLDLGVNFIDTANAYSTSEGRIGKAIAGRREGLIIATKTLSRKPEGIAKHLQHSLTQMGTDYIDLYQMHSVSDFATLDFVLSPGGPMSVLEDARKAGKSATSALRATSWTWRRRPWPQAVLKPLCSLSISSRMKQPLSYCPCAGSTMSASST